MSDHERAITEALTFLRAARDRIKPAKAKGALAKIRAAITSTQNELEKQK